MILPLQNAGGPARFWVLARLEMLTTICRYCGSLHKADFWGGEVEIVVLSKMLHTPIYVYKSAEEAGM